MSLAAGDKVGPYEILERIGAGGMGEVYKARDTRLNRSVAIKVLPERLSHDPQSLARFEREAKAVAALSHPNILVLFDIGSHDGHSYAVTELLEGETLADRLKRSALPWRDAVMVGTAVADGLSAAHTKGIIHRDVKPANIFLTSDGRVKILDFGLARQNRDDRGEDDATVTLTEVGTVLGTLGYMSPEQVRGQTAEAPSDLFSLGCVLYESITGRRPFVGSSAAEVMALIIKEEPTPPMDTGKEIPAELDRIIRRCLAKNPVERFHSAHDLAFALRGVLPVSSGSKTDSRRAASRHILIYPVAAAALLIAAFAYWWTRPGEAIHSLAVLPFVNAGGDPTTEYLSDGLTESLIDSLSGISSLKVMSRSAVFRYKGKETDAKAAGREMGVRAVLTGRITQQGDSLAISTELVSVDDDSALWGERYDRKLADVLSIEQEIAAQISQKLRLRLSNDQKTRLAKAQTENPEAYQLYLKGRYHAAKFDIENLIKGVDYFRQAVTADPNYGLAYDGLAYYYAIMDDAFAPAREVEPKAKEAARKALEIDDTISESHVEMGIVYFLYDFDWAAAEREFKRAIELNPNYAPAHEYYGWYLAGVGRSSEALAEGRRAEELDPLSTEIISILGFNLVYARHYDEAVTELRKCVDLDRDYWLGYWMIGIAYEQQGRYPEAIAAVSRAREIEPRASWAPGELARLYAVTGRQADARKLLAELSTFSQHGFVAKYPIATAYAALGEKQRALDLLEQAYEERSFFMALMNVDPEVDSLRSEPRFQDLLRRMNLAR